MIKMTLRNKALGLAALTSISLVGCTSRTETIYVPQTTEATTTTTTLPRPVPTTYGDYQSEYDLFLMSVYDMYGSRIYVSDSDLIDTGIAVCNSLWAGSTADDVIATLASSAEGVDSMEFLSAITASAVLYICPDQMYKFNNLS
jgi:hypothetical protein